jgi:hypothetical protein
MKEISVLIIKNPRELIGPFTMWGHSWNVLSMRKRASTRQYSASTLTLDFQPPEQHTINISYLRAAPFMVFLYSSPKGTKKGP